MVSRETYLRELVALLGAAPAQLCTVGQVNPALHPLLTDTTVRPYDDLAHCLDANTGTQSASVLMMIQTDAIDTLPKQLGALCQRFPNQVLIELQHEQEDKPAAHEFRQACFALGFRQALHSVSDGTEYQLYEYRLKNYKQAPDWLNSRFWANPERFNTR